MTPLKEALLIFSQLWFIWLPFFLFFIALSAWLTSSQTRYKKNTAWTMLEIRIPREITKNPRAMEQVLANLAGLRNVPGPGIVTTFKEKYLDGEVTLWFSLEIMSFGGEIHFFVRTPTKHKNIVEANFYAQYPDIEIAEADDYINRMPSETKEIYQGGYELAGGQFKLGRPEPYPIKTYLQYETPAEEQQLDPVSVLIELFGKIKPEEEIWLQFLIRPADLTPQGAWKKRCGDLAKKLKEAAFTKVPAIGPEAGAETMPMMTIRTPGETDILKVVEHRIDKPAFEIIIRWLYFAPPDIFYSDFANKGIQASLNQYAVGSLNFFLGDLKTKVKVRWHDFPYFFPRHRSERRKKDILKRYRERSLPEETWIGQWISSHIFHWQFASPFMLNAEELATIYHLPSYLVITAPFIRRVEAKKAGPPAGLPLFEE